MLAGQPPFEGKGNVAVLHAIINDPPANLREFRPDTPQLANQIICRLLQKDPAARYQSASDIVRETSALLDRIASSFHGVIAKRRSRAIALAALLTVLLTIATGAWLLHRSSRRQWAREEAIPQIASLIDQREPLAAFDLLEKAQSLLPDDAQLKQIADQNTMVASITSTPAGATAEIQDYSLPNGPWRRLGVTPIQNVSIPKGYFRWKISTRGGEEIIEGLSSGKSMDFGLAAQQSSPAGMVLVPGRNWQEDIDFIGWVGPYELPPFYIDRFEVTNREFQKFVDSGGYEKKEYWTQKFIRDGREIPWSAAMAEFRDSTDRPGPAGWVAGHYADGQADFPVTGMSWFEASAYATFAGKSLPVLAQWYSAAPPGLARYIVPVSNITTNGLTAVGTYKGVGPYGTYDMAGNIREWVANADESDHRFVLGGSWKSPSYLYFDPEALSPFDRSDGNGLRCVKNTVPLPDAADQACERKRFF